MLDSLPDTLLIEIGTFLEPIFVLCNLPFISKKWNRLSTQISLYGILKLSSTQIFGLFQLLSEWPNITCVEDIYDISFLLGQKIMDTYNVTTCKNSVETFHDNSGIKTENCLFPFIVTAPSETSIDHTKDINMDCPNLTQTVCSFASLLKTDGLSTITVPLVKAQQSILPSSCSLTWDTIQYNVLKSKNPCDFKNDCLNGISETKQQTYPDWSSLSKLGLPKTPCYIFSQINPNINIEQYFILLCMSKSNYPFKTYQMANSKIGTLILSFIRRFTTLEGIEIELPLSPKCRPHLLFFLLCIVPRSLRSLSIDIATSSSLEWVEARTEAKKNSVNLSNQLSPFSPQLYQRGSDSEEHVVSNSMEMCVPFMKSNLSKTTLSCPLMNILHDHGPLQTYAWNETDNKHDDNKLYNNPINTTSSCHLMTDNKKQDDCDKIMQQTCVDQSINPTNHIGLLNTHKICDVILCKEHSTIVDINSRSTIREQSRFNNNMFEYTHSTGIRPYNLSSKSDKCIQNETLDKDIPYPIYCTTDVTHDIHSDKSVDFQHDTQTKNRIIHSLWLLSQDWAYLFDRFKTLEILRICVCARLGYMARPMIELELPSTIELNHVSQTFMLSHLIELTITNITSESLRINSGCFLPSLRRLRLAFIEVNIGFHCFGSFFITESHLYKNQHCHYHPLEELCLFTEDDDDEQLRLALLLNRIIDRAPSQNLVFIPGLRPQYSSPLVDMKRPEHSVVIPINNHFLLDSDTPCVLSTQLTKDDMICTTNNSFNVDSVSTTVNVGIYLPKLLILQVPRIGLLSPGLPFVAPSIQEIRSFESWEFNSATIYRGIPHYLNTQGSHTHLINNVLNNSKHSLNLPDHSHHIINTRTVNPLKHFESQLDHINHQKNKHSPLFRHTRNLIRRNHKQRISRVTQHHSQGSSNYDHNITLPYPNALYMTKKTKHMYYCNQHLIHPYGHSACHLNQLKNQSMTTKKNNVTYYSLTPKTRDRSMTVPETVVDFLLLSKKYSVNKLSLPVQSSTSQSLTSLLDRSQNELSLQMYPIEHPIGYKESLFNGYKQHDMFFCKSMSDTECISKSKFVFKTTKNKYPYHTLWRMINLKKKKFKVPNQEIYQSTQYNIKHFLRKKPKVTCHQTADHMNLLSWNDHNSVLLQRISHSQCDFIDNVNHVCNYSYYQTQDLKEKNKQNKNKTYYHRRKSGFPGIAPVNNVPYESHREQNSTNTKSSVIYTIIEEQHTDTNTTQVDANGHAIVVVTLKKTPSVIRLQELIERLPNIRYISFYRELQVYQIAGLQELLRAFMPPGIISFEHPIGAVKFIELKTTCMNANNSIDILHPMPKQTDENYNLVLKDITYNNNNIYKKNPHEISSLHVTENMDDECSRIFKLVISQHIIEHIIQNEYKVNSCEVLLMVNSISIDVYVFVYDYVDQQEYIGQENKKTINSAASKGNNNIAFKLTAGVQLDRFFLPYSIN